MNKYSIKKRDSETNEMFIRRKFFIEKYKPKNKADFEEALILSYIWINIVYLKCVYKSTDMIKIKNILSNK